MQLRYLGDSHDYIKFALLRHLQKALNATIGVNWYLTDPCDVDKPNNQDGQKRHHMKGHEWACLDSDLFDKLRPFQLIENHSLDNFERSGILPATTLYYTDKVEAENRRSAWHERAISTLSQADVVFLDPDNGFQVISMSGKSQAKYALYVEAVEYFKRGKIVIGIQFARQCDPVARGKHVREKLIQSAKCFADFPIVRGRVSPNILFFMISSSDRAKEIREALEAFAAKSPVLKGCRKIELIR